MKDTFGFIERADIVKEIFFHYSEFKGDISELILGDDVSFGVQIRNVSITYEDIALCIFFINSSWWRVEMCPYRNRIVNKSLQLS